MRLNLIFFVMATLSADVRGAEDRRESWSAEKAVEQVCRGSVRGAPNGPDGELQVSLIYSGLRFRSDYEYKPVDAPLWKACMSNPVHTPGVRLFAAHYLLDRDEDARELIRDALASGDLSYRYNAAKAVDLHVRHHPPAEWGIATLVKLIDSGRLESVPSGENFFFSSPLDSICFTLGSVKAKRAVPALIELLERKPDSNFAASALGKIGDKRAIPILMKILENPTPRQLGVYSALGRLNCREAVPILTERLLADSPNALALGSIVQALADIDDHRCLRALEEFVAGDFPEREQAMARRLLVLRTSRNPVRDLLGLLEKETHDSACSDLMSALSEYDDPQVVESLASITRTSDSAFLRIMAMHGLRRIGSRESLLALAAMVDHQFPKDLKTRDFKSGWDRPEHLPERFAESLREATRQDFGRDRAKWEAWIRANVD